MSQCGIPLLEDMKVVALLAKTPANTVILYSHITKIITKRVCSEKEQEFYGFNDSQICHFILALIRVRDISQTWEPIELSLADKTELIQLCVYICKQIHTIHKGLVLVNMEFIRATIVRGFNRVTDTTFIENGFFSEEIQPFSALVPVVLLNMITPGLTIESLERKLLSRVKNGASTVHSLGGADTSQLNIFFSRFRCDYLAQISPMAMSVKATDILPLLTIKGVRVVPPENESLAINDGGNRAVGNNEEIGKFSLFQILDNFTIDQIGIINVILSILRLPDGACQCHRPSAMCAHIAGDGLFACFVRQVPIICCEVEIKNKFFIMNSAMRTYINEWLEIQQPHFRYSHMGPIVTFT